LTSSRPHNRKSPRRLPEWASSTDRAGASALSAAPKVETLRLAHDQAYAAQKRLESGQRAVGIAFSQGSISSEAASAPPTASGPLRSFPSTPAVFSVTILGRPDRLICRSLPARRGSTPAVLSRASARSSPKMAKACSRPQMKAMGRGGAPTVHQHYYQGGNVTVQGSVDHAYDSGCDCAEQRHASEDFERAINQVTNSNARLYG
jgi:hypothetical protein